jgi:hypothetical protein
MEKLSLITYVLNVSPCSRGRPSVMHSLMPSESTTDARACTPARQKNVNDEHGLQSIDSYYLHRSNNEFPREKLNSYT